MMTDTELYFRSIETTEEHDMSSLHPLIAEMANNDRAHDPWGAGMTVLDAVCDVLYVIDGDIPSAAGYRPAMGLRSADDLAYDEDSGENSDQSALLHAMDLGTFGAEFVDMDELTVDDLEYAALVLSRYLDIVKLAGRDY